MQQKHAWLVNFTQAIYLGGKEPEELLSTQETKKYEKLKEENKQTNTNNGTISTAKTDGYNIMSKDSESGERTNYLNLTHVLYVHRERECTRETVGSVKGSCKTLFKNLLISTLILWHFEVAISIFFFLLKT